MSREQPKPYKVTLCRHYMRGLCQRGASCGFAHGRDDVHFPTPMLVSWTIPYDMSQTPITVWAFGISVKQARNVLNDRLQQIHLPTVRKSAPEELSWDEQIAQFEQSKQPKQWVPPPQAQFPKDMFVFEGPYSYLSDRLEWVKKALEMVANEPPTAIQPCVAGVCSALDG